MKKTACNALFRCYNFCSEYKDQVGKPSYLHVAVQNKAHVCNISFSTYAMELIFTMPEDCELCMCF